jgi:hypothetical protein
MTLRLALLATITLFITCALPISAHEKFRIIGTVEKASAKELYVKQSKDGKVIGMDFTDTSLITRDGKKVAITQLKAGSSVVVDAFGDSIDELEVLEVKIVPPPEKK